MNTKLFNKNYVMVVVGQMVSIFGNAILRFALPLYVLDQTGSTTIFGSILALATIPTILFSPFGGILADRVNKKNMMVILDMITTVVIIAFSILLNLGSVVVVIAILMMLFSVIQSIYQPVVQACMPAIVVKDHLEKANGIVSLVNSLSNLIGPLLGGILYGAFGIWPIMITSAVCFFMASIMEMFIKIAHVKQERHDHVLQLIQSDLKKSFHFIFKENPIMVKLMIIVAGINFFLSSMIVIGMPVLIKVKLGLSSELYGYAQGGMAAGMIGGGLLISVLGKRLEKNRLYILLALASLLLVPIGVAFTLSIGKMAAYWTLLLSFFVMSAIVTMFNVKMMSIVQRETPQHLTGKVISYILVLTQCTLPIGQALYGYIFEIGLTWVNMIIFVTAFFCILLGLYSKKVFKDFNYRIDLWAGNETRPN